MRGPKQSLVDEKGILVDGVFSSFVFQLLEQYFLAEQSVECSLCSLYLRFSASSGEDSAKEQRTCRGSEPSPVASRSCCCKGQKEARHLPFGRLGSDMSFLPIRCQPNKID